jgi:hypothetical protein
MVRKSYTPEQIIKIIKAAIFSFSNMCKIYENNILQPLRNDADTMKEAINNLNDLLNPVMLRPLLIRTKCELCPV